VLLGILHELSLIGQCGIRRASKVANFADSSAENVINRMSLRPQFDAISISFHRAFPVDE